jgi:hypothetical protein
MSTTARLSFDEFLKLQEAEDRICYELDEGELRGTPSPTIEHNEIREIEQPGQTFVIPTAKREEPAPLRWKENHAEVSIRHMNLRETLNAPYASASA